MKRSIQGNYTIISTAGEQVKAFVPFPLPPTPPIDWTPALQGRFEEALLYLSLFFKTHRQIYYDLLEQARTEGDWEAWLDFFAEAVTFTSGQAVTTVRRLADLANTDRKKLQSLSHVTVNKSLDHLFNIGLITELTGNKRSRVFSYPAYIDILNEGMELPE